MKITVNVDSDTNNSQKKSGVHKRPWFWLLIILVVSIAVKAVSRVQTDLPTVSGDNSKPTVLGIEDSEIFSEEENPLYIEEAEVSEQPSNDTQISEESTAEKSNSSAKGIFHFILNTNTKKYHTKTCGAVGKLTEDKREDTDIEADTLEEAKEIIESQGYSLCGLCGR